MDVLRRNNVHVSGRGDRTMMFAHGFGCDQNMWRFVAPEFENDFKVVLFDHVGAGGSDLSAYDKAKYSTLHGYADDVVEIGRELGLKEAVFVGHSVSAMIGVLASLKAPDLFGRMVLVGPSARYIDDGDYVGGFSEKQIAELLEFLEDNHMGWSAAMAPSIMGNPDRPELGEELTNSFCRTDPEIAKAFARVTFTSDNRADLPKVKVPTLILQCSEDIIASEEVGKFVRSRIPGSEIVFLKATGHCPNLSAPTEVVSAIRHMSEFGPIDDYRDLFENAPCGYLTIGSDGRITKVNATLTAWTGFEADKFVGRRLHQFLNMAGRIYFETHIAPLLRMQGFFNEFALDFETAAGERLPVIANAAERRDTDGTLLFTALVVIKAADRRRYERQLVDSKSELQKGLASERESAELREQFIAVLGHDLRNPLAAISAGARILQRSGALQQQKELRVLDMINSTVTRMSDLIDNILDFARGRLGGGIKSNRDANRPLEPVLDQVVDELRTASPQRVIETSFEVTDPVDCDRTRIGQLASNLIGNALTHGARDKPVRVGAKTDCAEFKLWVANAGEPIPKAALQRLFEPFFRGDVRDSRQRLGLGLHIASQIAQAHGGRIDVTSTPDETRFVFTMPLSQTAAS